MGSRFRIAKKIIEFIVCLICCIGKYITDLEARRVFLRRQKYLREWSLIHTIFWDSRGDAFAWITYGGFTIITLLFGVGLCIDSKSRPTTVEKIFLFIGALMFFAVGGLVFASIDQIPGELIDNAIILGCLSFFAAFLLLVDMSEPLDEHKRRSGATQTDAASIDRQFPKSHSSVTVNSQANLMEPTSLESTGKVRDSMRSEHQMHKEIPVASNNPFIMNEQQQTRNLEQQNSLNSRTGDSAFAEDMIESHSLPTMQIPVFSKVKPTPTIAVHHLESEPYRKILQPQQQPTPYTRYHDTALQHQDPSFYDDFNSIRKQTYYQGPKVDQGKLLVIRDYSKQKNVDDADLDSAPMKPGYVHQVASFWNNRSGTDRGEGSQRSHHKEFKGSNTVV